MLDRIHFSRNSNPEVSIIFLDWSCRESFHSLDYLAEQTVSRDRYEIILIEYYARRNEDVARRLEITRAAKKPDPVDQWIILGMPESVCFHKHLMYNVGIAASRGPIILISDSDAMYRPTFVQSILETFELNKNIVLHYDEVRNSNRKFYPFNFPSFEEVTGEGASNWQHGTTTGLLDSVDPLHSLNFGAAFCALRQDLIEIGGSDEHYDYVGHVCGPYEMTFRLQNLGRRVVWHETEFLYHTWHPGQAGEANLVGPHDGAHISSRAIEAKETGRVLPWRENNAICRLRTRGNISFDSLIGSLLSPDYLTELDLDRLRKNPRHDVWHAPRFLGSVGNYNLMKVGDVYVAVPQPLGPVHFGTRELERNPYLIKATSEEGLRKQLTEVGNVFLADARIVNVIEDPRPGFTYNVLAFGTGYYGVPTKLGRVDFMRDYHLVSHSTVVFAREQEAVEQQIRKVLASAEIDVLMSFEPNTLLPVRHSVGEIEKGDIK